MKKVVEKLSFRVRWLLWKEGVSLYFAKISCSVQEALEDFRR